MDPRVVLRLPEDDKENVRHELTICTQKASRFNKGSRRNQRALKGVPLSSWLQLALYVFLKTSENEGNNKDLGKIKRSVHRST